MNDSIHLTAQRWLQCPLHGGCVVVGPCPSGLAAFVGATDAKVRVCEV
jgi:hypothetical protein